MVGTDQINQIELLFANLFFFPSVPPVSSFNSLFEKTRCQPPCYASSIQDDMVSNSDHTDAAAKQRQLRQQRNRSRSSISADPEEFLPSRPPSPPGPNANAPPPSERVTRLRLSAHYAVLVLSSMLGCVARVGLNALCTCWYSRYIFI